MIYTFIFTFSAHFVKYIIWLTIVCKVCIPMYMQIVKRIDIG